MSAITALFTQIGHLFAFAYNFIQTNWLFVSNLFNFIIVAAFFIWLLFYFLDIVGILDKKSKETTISISNSEDKKAEAQKYFTDTKKSIENIDTDIKNIVSEAKNIAKNIENKSNQKLEQELESIKNREEILKDAQLNKTKEELSVVVANAAIALSKEYMKNTLDETMHKELIMNFINDLDEDMVL